MTPERPEACTIQQCGHAADSTDSKPHCIVPNKADMEAQGTTSRRVHTLGNFCDHSGMRCPHTFWVPRDLPGRKQVMLSTARHTSSTKRLKTECSRQIYRDSKRTSSHMHKYVCASATPRRRLCDTSPRAGTALTFKRYHCLPG